MIGQIIQSYLVSLGVQIDKPGFQQADAVIKQTGSTVEKVTGSMGTSFGAMAANFVKAGTIISTALTGVTTSVVGLMTAAARQDMEMQKYAASMMMGRDAAEQMKRATDALGESIADITINPELMGRFRQLAADGGRMRVGGDFKETMKTFRDLIFEFTRLKQEASYAMTWIGYYLQKYLQKPLADIREKFRQFNDTFIKNMSAWTEKAARAIVYILNLGKHFLDFLMDVGKTLYKIWDSFPKGVKVAAAAITALGVVIKASPLGRIIMLVSTLLLLIDDYYGHMEDKQSAFGEYWDKLNGYIEIAKQKWEELKPAAEEYWNLYVEFLQTAGMWMKELVTKTRGAINEVSQSIVKKLYNAVKWTLGQVRDLVHFFGRLREEVTKTDEYKDFTEAIGELASVFLELLNTIMDLVGEAMRLLFGELDKTDKVYSFRDAIRAVLGILTGIIRALSWAIGLLRAFFKTVKDSDAFHKFWETLGSLIDKAIAKVGKFGRALLALKDGEFQKAWDIVKSIGEDEGRESGTGNTDWNKRVSYERLKAAGYNNEAIAGIMGRMQQEHNFDTSDVPEHWTTLGNGEKVKVGGFGMFQWNGERKAAMQKWAKENGLDPYDPGVQVDYAIIEAKKRGLDPEEMNKLSVAEAANRWTADWEVGSPGAELKYATQIYGEIKHGNDNTWMSAQPTKRPNGSRGDAAAENAVNMTIGQDWIGGATDNPRIQCDSLTAYIYNDSGIPSVGEHSTAWGNTINDDHFRAANAWHNWGDGEIQNGDMVGWDWGNGSWHYGIYNKDKDILVTRDSSKYDENGNLISGGIQQRSLREAIDTWGTPTGFGSIAEAEAYRKGYASQVTPMAYTTAAGASFMSTGAPMWQQLKDMITSGRPPMAQQMVAGMHGYGALPAYAGAARNNTSDSHNISVGDVIVQLQNTPGASAKEIGDEVSRRVPETLKFFLNNEPIGILV